ncbi:MAG TPA: hypothetical protein VNS33_05485, partial [Bradyrhizobium sp.]|nr:hypothetical protein [Bradyrhizobium sp.]
MTTFSDVLASLVQNEDGFQVEPSADWRRGRTLFGEISAYLAVLSAKRADSNQRSVLWESSGAP